MEEQDAAAAGTAVPPPGPAAPAAVAQPSTGDPRVDEAVARLSELPGLPAAEHPAVFEHVHRRLSEVLGDLGPGSAGH